MLPTCEFEVAEVRAKAQCEAAMRKHGAARGYVFLDDEAPDRLAWDWALDPEAFGPDVHPHTTLTIGG